MTERNKKYVLTLIEKDLNMTTDELSYAEKIVSGEEDKPITHMLNPDSWFDERKEYLVEQKWRKQQALDCIKEIVAIGKE
tara:strand:- start:386 stop:625 length:240 start_codon:yes stop_codon:yes gene_type:complete